MVKRGIVRSARGKAREGSGCRKLFAQPPTIEKADILATKLPQ